MIRKVLLLVACFASGGLGAYSWIAFSHPDAFALYDATSNEATVKRWVQVMRIETLRTCDDDLYFSHHPPIFAVAANHESSEHDDTAVLKVLDKLLRIGCKVDDKDINGLTPLHMAVIHGDETMVEYLLRHAANPYVRLEFTGFISGPFWKDSYAGLNSFELAAAVASETGRSSAIVDTLQDYNHSNQ